MRFLVTVLLAVTLIPMPTRAEPQKAEAFTLIVMDPLAADLSCPCVAGYAQRDYPRLAAHLEKHLGRPVKIHFAETLPEALRKKSEGKADLIIGKDSVVRHGAKAASIAVQPVASLTGKDGKTTQTGLVVVAARDPALLVSDLKGYRLLFGPDDCEEKHGAAFRLLKDNEVPLPQKAETCNSCSVGAAQVLKLHRQGVKVATVVSSYAQPLLEGCGTIKKGELRVLGETDPLPFIVAFANAKLSAVDREAVEKALLTVAKDPALCKAMETKSGFVALSDSKKK
jgi:ABC-type phosphate/phosphonate transport system substrate-binding protein